MALVNEHTGNPTTPHSQTHGINKSLLTPCRRVGLKRKSPTVSPSCSFVSGQNLSTPDKNEGSDELLSKAKCVTPNSFKSAETPKRDVKSTETPKRGEGPQKTVTSKKEHRVRRRGTQAQLRDAVENETVSPDVDNRSSQTDVTEIANSTSVDTDFEIVYDQKTLADLERNVAAKEDKVQSLRVAQLYRKKHDLTKLRESICKWKAGCQSALQDLLEMTHEQGHKVTMMQLLSHLGIPPTLIGYEPEQDEFT
ncbi:uncharacterized protein LOC126473318 [Schistocerca serialis cubense]|uniref:uncharacterized protein LOC126473318 n=1 Tax=Schistocerca serialis cubense TaxID=2023355 RepID=UPI00214EE7F3|nr:uncharacterized protein LOC126473318 [Schistocerca serialis cubense]